MKSPYEPLSQLDQILAEVEDAASVGDDTRAILQRAVAHIEDSINEPRMTIFALQRVLQCVYRHVPLDNYVLGVAFRFAGTLPTREEQVDVAEDLLLTLSFPRNTEALRCKVPFQHAVRTVLDAEIGGESAGHLFAAWYSLADILREEGFGNTALFALHRAGGHQDHFKDSSTKALIEATVARQYGQLSIDFLARLYGDSARRHAKESGNQETIDNVATLLEGIATLEVD